MDYLSLLFAVAGGLALFLFGLRFISEGLKKATGEQMKKMLEKLTNRSYKGVLVGTVTTGIIQSSSMTMVTLIGLINAGVLSLTQGVWVMLGAEIGTTITAQIIAFNIGVFYLPAIAAGFALWSLPKNQRIKNIGEIAFGFGIIFLGMSIMSGGLKTLGNEPFFTQLLSNYTEQPALGVLLGAVLTGIIQSSSAMTAIVIALGSENLITLPAAIGIIFGANIGTTVTGMIASWSSCTSSKRLSVCQVLVNCIGVIIFLPFILPFSSVVATIGGDLPRQIANAHSIFNIIVTLAMLPLVGTLVWLSKKIIPGEEPKIESGVKFIDKKLLKAPSIAVSSCKKEVVRLGDLAANMLKESERALLDRDVKALKRAMTHEEAVDRITAELDGFLGGIPQRELSYKDRKRVHIYDHVATDIERVADHAVNICDAAQEMLDKKIYFSPQAKKELASMFKASISIFRLSISSIEKEIPDIDRISVLEDQIDHMKIEFTKNHVDRLSKTKCDPHSGLNFVEALRNLERVGDHSTNIGNDVIFLKPSQA